MISPTLLNDAIEALELLGAGQAPNTERVLGGLLALDSLMVDQENPE